jgi:hypothetical protein
MGKIADVTFKGISGKEYSFVAYSLDTEFKVIGAVYIFTKRTVKDGKGSHKELYIGQTDNISERFEQHEKWPCITREGVNCICIHVEESKDKRFEKETGLRNNYDAPCNKQ